MTFVFLWASEVQHNAWDVANFGRFLGRFLGAAEHKLNHGPASVKLLLYKTAAGMFVLEAE